MANITAWSLEFVGGGSDKVYNIYVIQDVSTYWMAQWGKNPLPKGGGQWMEHFDGMTSMSMAIHQRDAKIAKGYNLVKYSTYPLSLKTSQYTLHAGLDKALNKALNIGVNSGFLNTPPPTKVVVPPKQVKDSLLKMLKDAGRI